MNLPKKSGTALAAAAALMFASGTVITPTIAEEAAASVACVGANACKGQGACKTASNECAGHNACKGKGLTHTSTAEECTSNGGEVVE